MALDGSPGGVLQLIREGRAVTRTDVMDVTGLSRSTVMQRVGVLLVRVAARRAARGRAVERRPPAGGADLQRARGRGAGGGPRRAPRAARGVRPRGRGLGRARGAAADRRRAGRRSWAGSSAPSTSCWPRPGTRGPTCWASAIGVPGPVEVATGRPVNPPIMPGWDGYPVADRLAARFGAPALLERDVNAMALGEHRRHWPDLAHMVFVKVATGIGAGIISGGALLRGNHGARRRHRAHPRAAAVRRRCAPAATAAASPCWRRARRSPASSARRGSRSSSTTEIVELVNAGDAVAMHHVREAGRVLGAALAGSSASSPRA